MDLQPYQPLVSIVIPARNESEDISRTLDNCLAIDYEPKEIIVVDDSSDNTPQIVSHYSNRGVRLIHRQKNSNGCCGARNLGMKKAQGEIVILLNADAMPGSDFISQILPHYQAHADYLIVQSVVKNKETIWGRYAWVTAEKYFSTQPDLEWSEGFSCRRSAAEMVEYIPGDYPVLFCRDYMFGFKLKQAGFQKHIDLKIKVEHVVPSSLPTYWRNQVWRGTFSAPTSFFIHHKSLIHIIAKELLKLARTLLFYLLVLPALWHTSTLLKFSPRGWGDFAGLFYVEAIQRLATNAGNFQGLARVLQFYFMRANEKDEF